MYIPIGVPRVFENLFFIYILLALLFIFVFSRFFFFFIIRFVSIFTLLCRPRTYIISKSTLWKVYFSINRSLPASFVLFSVCTLVLFCCLRFFFSFISLFARSVFACCIYCCRFCCCCVLYINCIHVSMWNGREMSRSSSAHSELASSWVSLLSVCLQESV